MKAALVNEPNKKTQLPKILIPLLKGKAIVMVVSDPKMRVKKRTVTPTLLISPISIYGMVGTDLLLSMPGYGCEVVSPGSITMLDIYRLGLTARSSKILATTLNKLYK